MEAVKDNLKSDERISLEGLDWMSKEALEELKQLNVAIEKKQNNRIEDPVVVDEYFRRDKKIDQVRTKIYDWNEVDYQKSDDQRNSDLTIFNTLSKNLSAAERREVGQMTGEMTGWMKNDLKDRALNQEFNRRNLENGMAGMLRQSKATAWLGTMIGGFGAKISRMAYKAGSFANLPKSWYLTTHEQEIARQIQSSDLRAENLRMIRAEAMVKVAEKSDNFDQEQKNLLKEAYYQLRLEDESERKYVEKTKNISSAIDEIKSPWQNIISNTKLRQVLRSMKEMRANVAASVAALGAKLTLGLVSPVVGWFAGGAAAGAVRESIVKTAYRMEGWSEEAVALLGTKNAKEIRNKMSTEGVMKQFYNELEKADVADMYITRELLRTVESKKSLVGNSLDYKFIAMMIQSLDKKIAKSGMTNNIECDEEINNAYKNRLGEHKGRTAMSGLIGGIAGTVMGEISSVWHGHSVIPASQASEGSLSAGAQVGDHSNHSLSDVYDQNGHIRLDEHGDGYSLKDYCHEKGILYTEDVKNVVKHDPEHFTNAKNLHDLLNNTGEGKVAFNEKYLQEVVVNQRNVIDHKTSSFYQPYSSEFDHQVTGMGDKTHSHVTADPTAYKKMDMTVETGVPKKGYAIIVDKSGHEHIATDMDNLGDIVDNKGHVLQQYHSYEFAELYNADNSCDNLYNAVVYYHNEEKANEFLQKLGIDPAMEVRGTDGQTFSGWLMEHGQEFKDSNNNNFLWKWIVYRDPAGAKQVVEAISDKNSDYPMIKELYHRYYGVPKESDFWQNDMPIDKLHGMHNSSNFLKNGIGNNEQNVPKIEMTNTGEIAPNANVNIDNNVNHGYNTSENVHNTVRPGYMTDNLEKYLSNKDNSSKQFLVADKPEVQYDARKFWHKEGGYEKWMGEEKKQVVTSNQPNVFEENKTVVVDNASTPSESWVKYQQPDYSQIKSNSDTMNQNYIQYDDSAKNWDKVDMNSQKNYIDMDVTEKK